MPSLIAQIAPQRSTQYASLSKVLAIHELILSPLGHHISNIAFIELGGHEYIRFDMQITLDERQLQELGMLSMTRAFYEFYETLADRKGPFLRPIDTTPELCFSRDLVMTRRYKGKTNEMFTHFLCNIARFSSGYSHKPWKDFRIFDPLSGGGTTLFTALALGANVAGVEKRVQDVQSTVAFLKQYLKNERLKFQVKEERLKKIGKRWRFTIGKENPKQCILSMGETGVSDTLIQGFKKPHLIVTDLPYGIQHHGQLSPLLTKALPVWSSILMPKGALVMAWESKRFSRDHMIQLIEAESRFTVLNDPPYDGLAHRVDRVIKERDIIVAKLQL